MNCMIRRQNSLSPVAVFESFFNEPFFTSMPTLRDGAEAMALDISETDTHVIVRASVPGFTKEQVEAEVHDGVLSLTATREESTEETTERYHRRERRTNTLARRVQLPAPVLEDQAQAELVNGVLTLRLPKPAQIQPRKIRIG
ncbi:MAG: hypothetical protein HBSAPP03_05410 [Phycisphaerae bacterium]|nr:MAG: hypothetical protein HBSAPP03_05410 [Phycisphaerae bacterium]